LARENPAGKKFSKDGSKWVLEGSTNAKLAGARQAKTGKKEKIQNLSEKR
jgi:hypothetical protein